jgi:hypothetical protein
MTGLLVIVSAWRHATFAAHGEHIRDGLIDTAGGWAADDITLFHGAAPGGDAIASVVARRLGWLQRPFPADWATHGRECGTTALEQAAAEGQARWCPGVGRCPRAGTRRNDNMVAAAVAVLADGTAAQVRCAAFPGPKTPGVPSGTRHCMGAAARAGMPVRPYPLAARVKETSS